MSRRHSKGALQTPPNQNNIYLCGMERRRSRSPPEKAGRHGKRSKEIMHVPDSLCTINRIVGCRANRILQFEKESGAKIDFAKVSDSNGNYEFRIHGPATCVSKAKQLMADLIEDISTNDSEERIEVSRDAVARLIGSRGSNIQKLQDRTGATVDIDMDSVPPIVCIRGSDESVTDAAQYVREFVGRVEDESKPVLTQELEVPKAVVRKLMGPHGEARKWLDQDAGMLDAGQSSRPSVSWAMSLRTFKVSLSLLKPIEDPATLRINGSFDSVLKAIEYIEALMNSMEEKKSSKQDAVDPEPSSLCEVTMEFPRDRAGDIIGPGGSRIHRLQIESGAKIWLDKGGVSCFVRISGDPDKVDKAKRLVRQVMAAPPVSMDRRVTDQDALSRRAMSQGSTSSGVTSKPRPSCAAHLLHS